MIGQAKNIEEFIGAILRGAVKILGLSSANLALVNRSTQALRVVVGTLAGNQRLGEVETLIGNALQETRFSFEDAHDSLVLTAWRERRVIETSTFAELVGKGFPESLTAQIANMVSDQRFLCVPAMCGQRALGVIVFTKDDSQPFGVQHREILLQYAQRIGEIVENDLRSRGTALPRDEQGRARPVASIQNQLLHFALGDTAPALLVDPDFNITSLNEATTQAFGYSPEELAHKPIGVLFRDAADIHAILNQQFLFHADGYFEDVSTVRHRNGRVLPVRVKALLLVDQSSRGLGFLVLIHDQSSMGEAGATHELMRRERLATMGEMAAQLAHEIRNPLVSLGSTLEMLGKDPAFGVQHPEMFTELAREVTRLDMILQDYLSLAARRNAKVAAFDLTTLIEDAKRIVAGARELPDHPIECCVAPGTTVMGDVIGLRQVVVNLLRNAVEASPRGGLIRCQVTETGEDVVLDIDDAGPGLSASVHECFKPFFTTKHNGTGLGLTVCQKIVEAHGGTLSLANRQGGGCRARVVLPRKAAS